MFLVYLFFCSTFFPYSTTSSIAESKSIPQSALVFSQQSSDCQHKAHKNNSIDAMQKNQEDPASMGLREGALAKIFSKVPN
jgi:hypothetical protein